MTELTLNDHWHTAVHEAGHAVIGRVLGMTCGQVSILADHDSAGHSICADPWLTLAEWERCDRYREVSTVYRGRIMSMMAGAEAEVALIGFCEGGDIEDRREIAMMIASRHSGADDDAFDRVEKRLRRATAHLVRRHAGKIDRLAKMLEERGFISDDAEIRTIAELPGPRPPGPIWLAFHDQAASV